MVSYIRHYHFTNYLTKNNFFFLKDFLYFIYIYKMSYLQINNNSGYIYKGYLIPYITTKETATAGWRFYKPSSKQGKGHNNYKGLRQFLN